MSEFSQCVKPRWYLGKDQPCPQGSLSCYEKERTLVAAGHQKMNVKFHKITSYIHMKFSEFYLCFHNSCEI